jgi:tryptophanyl-tRNA synthetase
VTGETEAAILSRFEGQGFGAFKPALADALIALISPDPRSASPNSPATRLPLTACSMKAPTRPRTLADPTLLEVKRAVGLSRH